MNKKDTIARIRTLMAENRRIWEIQTRFVESAFKNEAEAHVLRMQLESRFKMRPEEIHKAIWK